LGGSDESAGRSAPVRLLFVCLGNICRSPTAEGVMRSLIAEANMEEEVLIDSAGTGAWHVGSAPDGRATAAAGKQGVTLAGQARKITPQDYERFDLILAMDDSNLRDLHALAPDAEARAKVRLLREFDPASASEGDLDVPDPYYGGEDGFGTVFALVDAACRGLLGEIQDGRLP
jgi:protein-tyrosine phosphatase